jgi:hypothetical protein
MEENEWAFCSLWSKRIRIGCATALLNPTLKDDYFFNRATIENCDIPYSQVASVFWKEGMDCHLYFKLQPPRELRIIDTMYILRSVKKEAGLNGSVRIRLAKPSDATTWVDLFCRSFSVLEWNGEVSHIIAANSNKMNLLLAYKGDTPAGCAAIFNKSDLMGLYCLGTVPMQRSTGVAASILKYAKTFAAQHNSPLFLQTFGSEKLLDLYRARGFEVVYTKSICVLPKAN